jgi:transposase
MRDKKLYQKLLGLSTPWSVNYVELRMNELKVTVRRIHQTSWRFRCPECDEECPTHDHRHSQWRHLDTCGFVTMVEAEVPRSDCKKHGVHQVRSSVGRTRLPVHRIV